MLEKLHKINVKYTLAFILVALSLLGVVVVDSLLVQSIRERMTAFSGSFNPAVSAVLNADRDLYQSRVAELEVLREESGSQAASAQYDDYLENAEQAYDRMHDFLTLLDAYPQVSEGLEPFEDRFTAWEAASLRVFELHADGEVDAAEEQLEGDSLTAFNSLRELYNIAGESADARGLALEEETLAQVAVQQRWVMGFTALVLLATLVIALMGPNLMSRALRQVSGRIRDITQGEGDLTARINSQRRDEIGELAREFDGFIARMDVSFQAVRDGARNVNVASNEIATGSEDLASRTEEQASALQETASSMEEMSSIVRQNSESASNADTLSSQASEKAEKGVKEVQHSVALMRELETSSRQVGEIVEVIDSIAFQTNILALNASVEAARAGEHGRGFAVVASEVRNLASRSADSSKKIREMITDISQRIASGAEQAVRSGEGIQDTVEAIRQVSGLMNEISLAVREQESGIQQVGTALTQMDSATQQNVTLVSQTSGSAASLQQEANRLTRLVDAFKLSGDSSDTASSALPKPASQQVAQRNPMKNEPEWEAFLDELSVLDPSRVWAKIDFPGFCSIMRGFTWRPWGMGRSVPLSAGNQRMDPHKLAVALAIAAGWLSFNSLILSMYFILSKRGILEVDGWKMGEWLKLGRRLSPVAERDVLPSRSPVADIKVNTSSTLPSHEDSVEEVAPEKGKAGEYSAVHVLFVMYSQPNIAINKKLQLCLQNWEAHYDADLKVYIVPGVTPQNPLRIANAYPPGEMPSLEAFQQTENLISGVSVILEKPKRKRGFDKVQLEKLIIFTQQLAALGGEILDAQRQVATLKTFNAIRYK